MGKEFNPYPSPALGAPRNRAEFAVRSFLPHTWVSMLRGLKAVNPSNPTHPTTALCANVAHACFMNPPDDARHTAYPYLMLPVLWERMGLPDVHFPIKDDTSYGKWSGPNGDARTKLLHQTIAECEKVVAELGLSAAPLKEAA